MDWWWSRFEKGLAVTSMWWEARLSDTHLTMMNALRGDISGDELCSRDVPVPDNKSLRCCWCNSLPTMINPLMNGWFWWLWGSCWPAPPSWTLIEVPYPPIDWSVSYFSCFYYGISQFWCIWFVFFFVNSNVPFVGADGQKRVDHILLHSTTCPSRSI